MSPPLVLSEPNPARIRIFAILLFAGAPQYAAGAETLGPVVVESTRIESELDDVPAAVSVVGRDDLQQARPGLGFDEAFVTVPGVFALNRYNFAQDPRLSIRGFGARSSFGIRGIRVFVDGIPLTGPDGQTSLDDVDPGLLERMEILRGPAGSLYGSAAGGVVSLYTEPAGGTPYAEGRVTGGANGLRQLQAKAAGEFGETGETGYLLSASHLSLDGYREHSATERTLFNTKLTHRVSENGRLDASLALLNSPQAQDPGALTPEQADADPQQAAPLALRFDTGERVTQQRGGITYRHRLDDRRELRLRAYAVNRGFDNRLPFSAVALDRRMAGGGAEYEWRHGGQADASRSLLGFDLDGQWDDRRRYENLDGELGALIADQDEDVDNAGLFLLHERRLSDTLRLDLGLRYDHVRIAVDDRFLSDGDDSDDVSYQAWSPSIALGWTPFPATRLYARVANAFETPTTVELAATDGGGGLNEDLDAQQVVNYEIGVRGVLGTRGQPRTTYELALFRIDVDDQLVPFEIPGSPGRYAYENAGASTYRGLESALSLHLAKAWRLRLAYTWSDFRFDRFTDTTGLTHDGNRVPGVPRHLAGASLEYRPARGPYALGETQYVGEYYADNANTQSIDAYTVTNLRAGWPLAWSEGDGDWLVEPYLGAYNLFDEDYNANVRLNAGSERYLEPAPGLELYAGISVSKTF